MIFPIPINPFRSNHSSQNSISNAFTGIFNHLKRIFQKKPPTPSISPNSFKQDLKSSAPKKTVLEKVHEIPFSTSRVNSLWFSVQNRLKNGTKAQDIINDLKGIQEPKQKNTLSKHPDIKSQESIVSVQNLETGNSIKVETKSLAIEDNIRDDLSESDFLIMKNDLATKENKLNTKLESNTTPVNLIDKSSSFEEDYSNMFSPQPNSKGRGMQYMTAGRLMAGAKIEPTSKFETEVWNKCFADLTLTEHFMIEDNNISELMILKVDTTYGEAKKQIIALKTTKADIKQHLQGLQPKREPCTKKLKDRKLYELTSTQLFVGNDFKSRDHRKHDAIINIMSQNINMTYGEAEAKFYRESMQLAPISRPLPKDQQNQLQARFEELQKQHQNMVRDLALGNRENHSILPISRQKIPSVVLENTSSSVDHSSEPKNLAIVKYVDIVTPFVQSNPNDIKSIDLLSNLPIVQLGVSLYGFCKNSLGSLFGTG